jgi:hypothetical protein
MIIRVHAKHLLFQQMYNLSARQKEIITTRYGSTRRILYKWSERSSFKSYTTPIFSMYQDRAQYERQSSHHNVMRFYFQSGLLWHHL